MHIRKALLMMFMVALLSLFLGACGNSAQEDITVSTGEETEATEQDQEESVDLEEQEESEVEPVDLEEPELNLAESPIGTHLPPEIAASLIGTWAYEVGDSEVSFYDETVGSMMYDPNEPNMKFVWWGDVAGNGDIEIEIMGIGESFFTIFEQEGEYFLEISESLDNVAVSTGLEDFVFLFMDYAEEVTTAVYPSIYGVWALLDDSGNITPVELIFLSDNTGGFFGNDYGEEFFWGVDYDTGELLIAYFSATFSWNITLMEDAIEIYDGEFTDIAHRID